MEVTLQSILKENREAFEREFRGAVLGTLSGDAKSPVFVNNELEIPRLLTFLDTALTKAIISAIKEEREWMEAVCENTAMASGFVGMTDEEWIGAKKICGQIAGLVRGRTNTKNLLGEAAPLK